MNAEVLRVWLWVALAVFQILAVLCGLGVKFADRLVGKNESQEFQEHVDSRFDQIEALGVAAVVNSPLEKPDTDELLRQMEFPEVMELLDRLRVQRKLLQDAFERTSIDSDYVHDLSTRLNCLIGTDDGVLYLVITKLGIGLSCYDKFDPDKKRYELKEFFQRKNYRATVDGIESAYSVQDIIHLMATKEGGAQIDLKTDEALRRLTQGLKIGRQDAGTYTLLRTAKQVIGDVDQTLEVAQKYYVVPTKLIVQSSALKKEGDFEGAIAVLNEAKAILSEFRDPHSNYMIDIEIQLSAVYEHMKDYNNALQHAEKACELLGDKEWTGSLAPTCKEGVAFALLRLNVPSTSAESKAAYRRSIAFSIEAVRLKLANPGYRHTPLHANYDALAAAYLFLGDYVSALDSAQKAQELLPFQAYVIKEGLALLGLKKHSEANNLFLSVRSADPRLTDALVEYSNNLVRNDTEFCAADIWAFMR